MGLGQPRYDADGQNGRRELGNHAHGVGKVAGDEKGEEAAPFDVVDRIRARQR